MLKCDNGRAVIYVPVQLWGRSVSIIQARVFAFDVVTKTVKFREITKGAVRQKRFKDLPLRCSNVKGSSEIGMTCRADWERDQWGKPEHEMLKARSEERASKRGMSNQVKSWVIDEVKSQVRTDHWMKPHMCYHGTEERVLQRRWAEVQ